MKAFVVLWCVAALWPINTFAGNIFGSLFESGRPAQGVEVTVTCGENSYGARTDKDGSYGLRTEEAGRCTFSVNYKEQTTSVAVFSYDQPTRYDFELVMEDGKYTLKKK